MLIKFTRRKRCQMSQHAYLWPSTLSPFDVIGSNIYIYKAPLCELGVEYLA